MSTTFFPTSATFTPPGFSWVNTGSYNWGNATSTFRVLSAARGSGVVSRVDATSAGLPTTVSEANVTALTGVGMNGTTGTWVDTGALVFISAPVNAFTLAGTITVNARAAESAAQANYGIGASIHYEADENGSTPGDWGGASAALGVGQNTTELGTSEAARSISITPTSTDLPQGARLILVLVWCSAGGTSTSGRTATAFYNGASGATGDCFVTFTETITLATTPRPALNLRQAVQRASNY